jgi:hypothetical protein
VWVWPLIFLKRYKGSQQKYELPQFTKKTIYSYYCNIMKSSLIAIVGLFAAACNAMPTSKRAGYDITLTSDTEFCSFVPPQAGDNVGTTENQAIPKCTDSSLGNEQFPTGFIKSSHYASTSTYAQVTGTIDRTAYNLNASDGGGQYDNRDISGVTCNGYKYFVNLVEPDTDTFCIRCCESQSDCNLGESTKGCVKIVPGDYS